MESGSDFVVAEVFAAQNKEFGMARGYDRKHLADAVALLLGNVELFRRGCGGKEVQEPLVALAPGLAAELVEGKMDRCAREPA